MPGCNSGRRGVVGHFTAMIWKSATTLGCAYTADGKGVICRYGTPNQQYSSNCAKPTAPNMSMKGCYENNVFASGTQLPASCAGAGVPPAAPVSPNPPPPVSPSVPPPLPPPVPPPASSCEDQSRRCAWYTRYCGNHGGITQMCPKTCGTCTGGPPPAPRTRSPVTPTTRSPVTPTTGAPVRPPPVTRPTGGNCRDSSSQCPRWSRFCASNPSFAQRCKKTCGKCSGGSAPAPISPPSQCTDKGGALCQRYKPYCNRHSGVQRMCRRTCERC